MAENEIGKVVVELYSSHDDTKNTCLRACTHRVKNYYLCFIFLFFLAALRENLLFPSCQEAKNAEGLFFQTVYIPCDSFSLRV